MFLEHSIRRQRLSSISICGTFRRSASIITSYRHSTTIRATSTTTSPGPSQLQLPVAAIILKALTVHKISRQIKTEELVSSPNFKGHPKYDMSLNYKLQNHANLYKLVYYNPKTKTYRAKNLGIDKQVLSVPFHLLTANLESSEKSYIRNLEQSFLNERYKNYQHQQRIESQLRDLRDYRHDNFRGNENFSHL